MGLSVKALAMVLGLLWGSAILLVGMVHLVIPSYGVSFLAGISSVYPGFNGGQSFGDVVIGTVYGLLDGGFCGLFIAWLYNRLGRRRLD